MTINWWSIALGYVAGILYMMLLCNKRIDDFRIDLYKYLDAKIEDLAKRVALLENREAERTERETRLGEALKRIEENDKLFHHFGDFRR